MQILLTQNGIENEAEYLDIYYLLISAPYVILHYLARDLDFEYDLPIPDELKKELNISHASFAACWDRFITVFYKKLRILEDNKYYNACDRLNDISVEVGKVKTSTQTPLSSFITNTMTILTIFQFFFIPPTFWAGIGFVWGSGIFFN